MTRVDESRAVNRARLRLVVGGLSLGLALGGLLAALRLRVRWTWLP